ncbi:hypothetical protein K1W54_04490 [Micromonospora sp. CPCC 205371]|nr:hypothetical protein [Micromonospora sp. CPCC 205371]
MAGVVALLFVLAAIGCGIEAIKGRSWGWAGLCALCVGLAAPAVAAVL